MFKTKTEQIKRSTVCSNIKKVVAENIKLLIIGDQRVNENPLLAILQIFFAREHNRIAKQLKSINPHWTDETLYQVFFV